MLQLPMNPMENHFIPHGQRSNHFSFRTVFPFAYSNLVEIEDALCTRILDMALDVFKTCFNKSSRHFRFLVFLRGTFRLKDFIGMPGQK
jgi:hypothetical protein